MTEKEMKEFWDEVAADEEAHTMAAGEKVYKFKCKPVWQFQSIEFEVTGSKKDIPEIMDLYSEVLAKLMLIAPEQKKDAPAAPAVPLASEKQKEIMRKFDIPFTNKTTQKEAQGLIQASIDKNNK